jgi:copper chaperone
LGRHANKAGIEKWREPFNNFQVKSKPKTKRRYTMKVLTSALVIVLTLSVVSLAAEKKVEIKVDGMSCNGCVNKVKTSLEKVEGVKSAEVSLEKHSAVVVFDDSKTNETALKTAVNATGFKAVEAKAGCGSSADCGGCPANKAKS